jgi:hypothetical protein
MSRSGNPVFGVFQLHVRLGAASGIPSAHYGVAVVREGDLRAPSVSIRPEPAPRAIAPGGLRQLWIHAAAFAASNHERIVARCPGFLIIS